MPKTIFDEVKRTSDKGMSDRLSQISVIFSFKNTNCLCLKFGQLRFVVHLRWVILEVQIYTDISRLFISTLLALGNIKTELFPFKLRIQDVIDAVDLYFASACLKPKGKILLAARRAFTYQDFQHFGQEAGRPDLAQFLFRLSKIFL